MLALSVKVIYSFAKAGQELADLYRWSFEVLIKFLNFVFWIKISCRKIKESLQEIIIIEVNSISTKERIKLEVLIDNFSEKCPFTPLGVLDVNLSNAVSMAGLSFTYVIVLLQFQISDRYQTPNIYLNSTVT